MVTVYFREPFGSSFYTYNAIITEKEIKENIFLKIWIFIK
jgi:hypothetical protein